MTASPVTALIDAALRGMTVSLLLLMAWTLWRQSLPQRSRTGLWLTLGLVVQLLGSAPVVEWQLRPLWQAPMVAVAVGNALLFWLFVRAICDDDFLPGRRHTLTWCAFAALGFVNAAIVAERNLSIAAWTFGLQRAATLLAAGMGAWAALRHWTSDLVESRRRLRLFIVVVGSGYTVMQVGLRLASDTGMLGEVAALADTLMLLTLVAVVAQRVLQWAPGELFPDPTTAGAVARRRAVPVGKADEAVDAADEELRTALLTLMRDERAYRDEGLSVAALAARLRVPEYRLRRVINRQLGHRNFNTFINGFRLAEAREALADPMRRATPILTIALTAGFQSIGPFNRAFKEASGLTPGEFRRQNMADS